MEVVGKIVNDLSFLTIIAKSSILDVLQDSEFASKTSNDLRKKPHLTCLIEFWTHLCINYFRKTIVYLFTQFDKEIRWRRGVVDITTAQLHSTKPGLRFYASTNPARRVGDSRWRGSLTMVPAGNKAKRLSSVNHTTKTIHQFNSVQISSNCIVHGQIHVILCSTYFA